MKSISHSQFTSYNECNLKWKLRYIDELSLSSGNIYTLFGSAMHTVIQEYLVTMYNKSIVDAEKLDLESMLKDEMVKEFNEIKEKLGILPCEQKDMIEFYQDGVEIFEDLPDFACDNPDLKGMCLPGSRIQRIEGYSFV